MRIMTWRHMIVFSVSQICWMAPGPAISAITRVSPASLQIDGETFHPWPRPRAGLAPVPSVAIPPRPTAPSKFSGEIERVLACESRERLPRCNPNPLKPGMVSGFPSVGAGRLEMRQDVFEIRPPPPGPLVGIRRTRVVGPVVVVHRHEFGRADHVDERHAGGEGLQQLGAVFQVARIVRGDRRELV